MIFNGMKFCLVFWLLEELWHDLTWTIFFSVNNDIGSAVSQSSGQSMVVYRLVVVQNTGLQLSAVNFKAKCLPHGLYGYRKK